MSINFDKKECPDCGLPMALTTDNFLWYCTDHVNCGYSEYCEDGKPALREEEEEENDTFTCPHCNKQIDKEDLPDK